MNEENDSMKQKLRDIYSNMPTSSEPCLTTNSLTHGACYHILEDMIASNSSALFHLEKLTVISETRPKEKPSVSIYKSYYSNP